MKTLCARVQGEHPDDRVSREFQVSRPNALWVSDLTPASAGAGSTWRLGEGSPTRRGHRRLCAAHRGLAGVAFTAHGFGGIADYRAASITPQPPHSHSALPGAPGKPPGYGPMPSCIRLRTLLPQSGRPTCGGREGDLVAVVDRGAVFDGGFPVFMDASDAPGPRQCRRSPTWHRRAPCFSAHVPGGTGGTQR